MARKGIPVTDELQAYLLAHSIPRTDVHRRLVTATADALGDAARMQISEEQGPFLTLLARMVGARLAVEVGTFTGLSALCIAEGLAEGGRLMCFDVSEEWTSLGRPYWDAAGVGDRIDVVIGPAQETLAAYLTTLAPGAVDLAFIDADKDGYPTYYELLVPQMARGGLIVFDNALYGGSVLTVANGPAASGPDETAAAIHRTNELVALDERVDTVLLNVGDGLLIARVR